MIVKATRGQGTAYFLEDDKKGYWILKKFGRGKSPAAAYIKAVSHLLPDAPGFESGSRRIVISKNSQISSRGFYSKEFPAWLDNTILMTRIMCRGWAGLAGQIRDSRLPSPSREQRLLLCHKLSRQVQILEKNGLAHRDLSSTNIMIDTNTWDIHFIDWDSLYHASLTMPANTTVGTKGYISPLVKDEGADAFKTWTPYADRFSLAVLNLEFMALKAGSPLTSDGGMVNQEEIVTRGGRDIDIALRTLERNFSGAEKLFLRALNAQSFSECPSPDEWIEFCGFDIEFKAPSLNDSFTNQKDFLDFLNSHYQESAIAAPALADLPEPNLDPKRVLPRSDEETPAAPPLNDIGEHLKDIREKKKLQKKK